MKVNAKKELASQKITIFLPANVQCKHLLKAHTQDSTKEIKEVLCSSATRPLWFREIQGKTGVKGQDGQEHENEVLGLRLCYPFVH